MTEPPLVRLGRLLRDRGYQFTTITPESHARVNRRPGNEQAKSLRDIFGWTRPFKKEQLDPELQNLVSQWGTAALGGDLLKSTVRYSTYEDKIFVHSAFPTTAPDSVFFGPDTYRYLNVLKRVAPKAKHAVDVGCGTGAGGIVIANQCEKIILADINPKALEYARINVELNCIRNAEFVQSDVLKSVPDPVDLVISNPPYLIDEEARVYRDGGGRFGEGLSVKIVEQALERLPQGGRIILYTASAIVDGVDTFREAIEAGLGPRASGLRYEELDPDVFGEELSGDAYAGVDRLAVVALDATV